MVVPNKVEDHIFNFIDLFFCISRGEPTIGGIVSKMSEHTSNVLGSLQDTRTKVLIGWKDDKILVLSEIVEELLLVGRQVWCDSTPNERGLELLQKVSDS
jgi:hypothetical protein